VTRPSGFSREDPALSSHYSHLVLGGVKSGKSRFVLDEAKALRRPTGFLATARPTDPELVSRIARHRAARPPGWTTVEEPVHVVPACRRLAQAVDVLVLDCVTLWVAAIMEDADDAAVLAATDQLAAFMDERLVSLLIVSNEVGQGAHAPTALGLRFVDLLGRVNQRIAAAADCVTLMVAGLPITAKASTGSAPHEPRNPDGPTFQGP
jgi:adenosylcobinamide kinase/adenosylcobinamide-phosphate guanylyltransferase